MVRVVAEGHDGPEGFLAGGPELFLFFLAFGEFKGLVVVGFGERFDLFDLFFYAQGGAAELEEEGGGFFPVSRGCAGFVDAAHLDVVEEFHGGDGDAGFDGAGDEVGGVADGGEGYDGDGFVLGLDGEFEGGFGDEAEGAFGADKEFGEVVAGGGFTWALAGFDDGAVGEDDSHGEDPFAHGAVAGGVGAGAAGANHAADHGAWSWVGWEKEVVFGEEGAEVFPTDSGLDDNVEIIGVEGDNLVHAVEIDADAASGWSKVAFERGAAGEGSDGETAEMADFDNLRDFGGAGGIDDEEWNWIIGVRWMRGPFGGGMSLALILGGLDVFGTEEVDEFLPGALEVCFFEVVFWREGEHEGLS